MEILTWMAPCSCLSSSCYLGTPSPWDMAGQNIYSRLQSHICCSGQISRRAEIGVWQNSIPSVLSGKLWVLTYFLLWYYLLVQAKSSLYHLQYYRLHRPARSRQGQDFVVPHDEDHQHDQHVGVVRAGEPLLHPCLDHQHPGCLLYCLPLHTQQVIVLCDYLSINS